MENVLIDIIHKDKHIELDLSKYSTIDKLKEQLFYFSDIQPVNQIFEGLTIEPNNDYNILEYCINNEVTSLKLSDAREIGCRQTSSFLINLDSNEDMEVNNHCNDENLIDLEPSTSKGSRDSSVTLPTCNHQDAINQTTSMTLNQVNQEAQDLIDTTPNDFGSNEYQQMMFDMLCDRDFDNFEINEHVSLKNKIGFALYGPPQEETGYPEKQNKHIDNIYKCILKQNYEKYNGRVVLSIIYNCTEPLPAEKLKREKQYSDYNPKTDLCPRPIFVIRKCRHTTNKYNACVVYIDDTARSYQNWIDYIEKNKLPKCVMILPKDGRYQSDEHGKVLLECRHSPACGLGTKILKGTDITSASLGMISGGVFLAAAIPAITVAPVAIATAAVAGFGVGIYTIGRSAYSLFDRKKHKESLSFANSEARGAYISIVAGSLGFVGAGANVIVSKLISEGVNIGKVAAIGINSIGVINIGVSGAGIVNSGYDIFSSYITDKQAPSTLALLQLSSSILFFGHAVYNFKSVNTLIDEKQFNILKDYSESLRSNRHRKTFVKLTKSTIKNNGGNNRSGQAQVIKLIRNISNKDEVFAALTRNNKEFNKSGIKYYVEGGKLKLNGHTINVTEFMMMNKSDVKIYLSDLPKAPEPTTTEVNDMTISIEHSCSLSYEDAAKAVKYVIKTLYFCEGNIQDKLLNLAADLFCSYLKEKVEIIQKLNVIYPLTPVFYKLLKFVIYYFKNKVEELEEDYNKWLKTHDKQYYHDVFNHVIPVINYAKNSAKRFQYLFNYSVNLFCKNSKNNFSLMEAKFYNWFTKEYFEYQEKCKRDEVRSKNTTQDHKKINCTSCGGYYYILKK